MKKFLFILLCAFASIGASAQDGKLTLNTGFLFPSTLNATLGYEHPLSYGNAVEVFGEVGDHWQTPVSDRFWKGYYWDGSVVVQAPPCPLQERDASFPFRPAVRGCTTKVLSRFGGRL